MALGDLRDVCPGPEARVDAVIRDRGEPAIAR